MERERKYESLDLNALERRATGWLDVKTAADIKLAFAELRAARKIMEAARNFQDWDNLADGRRTDEVLFEALNEMFPIIPEVGSLAWREAHPDFKGG